MFRHALRYLRRPFDLLIDLLTDASDPRQIAWGFALGMLIGLVPKGNLTAGVLTLVLLATRANLAAAGLATLLFSWLGMLADPLTHRLGLALLSSAGLRPVCDWLYRQPIVPWFHLHNTVVLGNLLCGLALLLPVYALGLRGAERLKGWVAGHWEQWRLKGAAFAVRLITRWSTR
jgi:uncharacterized protein (TIGR03546 family)